MARCPAGLLALVVMGSVLSLPAAAQDLTMKVDRDEAQNGAYAVRIEVRRIAGRDMREADLPRAEREAQGFACRRGDAFDALAGSEIRDGAAVVTVNCRVGG
ncbi:hypothetical protein DU478_16275 [Thalassococcus profundi]|uniref:UrcA family protein n=1 Tax=Thalassococcus profundi TaxID=2282382 RepID=A0A369TIS8_9RHOB|nr:hypothetical protein [Thalassococcus profundi]RDD65213.1 hypothetical protein DU478_16275 [Thalassococcus profundi]